MTSILNNKDLFIKFCFFIIGVLLAIASFFVSAKLILLSILGLSVIVFSFFKLELSFIIFLFLSFVVPHQLWNNIYLFIAVVFYFSIFFIQTAAKKRTVNIKDISPSLLIFLMVSLASLIVSNDFWDSLRIIILLLSGIFTAIMIQYIVIDKKTLNLLILFLFFSVLLTSLFGLYQYNSGIAIRLDFIDVIMSAGVSRLYSTMDNPNNFAEFLVLFLPIMASFIFNCKEDTKKLLFFILILPCFLALVLTFSRASYICIVVASAIFIFLINKRLVPFCIILFIALIPLIPDAIVSRLLTIGKDSSSEYRLMIWEGSLNTLKNNWLFGIGVGPSSFAKVYRAYVEPEASSAMHSHNLFLQIWLEMGILGIISFSILIFNSVKTCIANSISLFDKNLKYYYYAYTSSIIAIIMIGMVEYIWFYPRVMFAFWIVIGLILATDKISRGN